MRTAILYISIFTLLWSGCTRAQQPQVVQTIPPPDGFELTPEKSHPNAKALLTDEFYWSGIEETAPFGSDDGSDAFYGFRVWRQTNKTQSPIVYLQQLIEEWDLPAFDLNIVEAAEMKKLISDADASVAISEDNAVIAIGFGQFVIEGKINKDIKALTRNAIQRQLFPDLINQFRADYRETRIIILNKMLVVVNKMNEIVFQILSSAYTEDVI